jgi:hypothetical protein
MREIVSAPIVIVGMFFVIVGALFVRAAEWLSGKRCFDAAPNPPLPERW